MATPPTPPPMRAGPPPMDGAPPMGGPPPESGGANDIGQRVIAEIPEPKKGGYTAKVVTAVAEQLLDTWEAVSEYIPLPPAPPMEALIPPGYTGDGKLPEGLVVAFTILLTAIAETAAESRYEVDVAALVDDMAVRKIEGQLKLLAKDKKVRKKVEEMLKAEGHSEPDADDMGGPSDGDADNMGGKMKEPPPIPKGVRASM
jgi:hypothetical protein